MTTLVRRRLEVMAVVVTYNSERHVEALAGALTSGSVAPDAMLIVDNASTDDTVAQARRSGFEVHEMGSNDGFGAACNAALRFSDAEYLLICNPDIRPSGSAIEQLLTALSNIPDAAVAGAACDQPFYARRFSTISGNLWTFLPRPLQRRLMRFAPEIPVDPSGYHVADYVIGAFMLCRTAALREVGGFDERFFLYNEEEDLCRRLGEHGWKTMLIPAVVVAHEDRTSSAGVSRSDMASYYFHSLYIYYRKHRSRLYAETARVTVSLCVLIDRGYRRLSGRAQVYSSLTISAPFRDICELRGAPDRRTP